METLNVRVRRAYEAGKNAYRRGLPSDPTGLQDGEYTAEFRRGWQDERRKAIAHGGRRNVQTR